MTPGAPDRVRWGVAVPQGAFLACSWTWCIGMFLPALLVADFGVAGWFIFAVPNILGAMAMGLALRGRGAAARLRSEHAWAGAVFSSVTLAFHAFFVAWTAGEWLTLPAVTAPGDAPVFAKVAIGLVNALFADPGAAGLTAVAMVFGPALLASMSDSRAWRRAAVALWGVSIALVLTHLFLSAPGERVLPATSGVSPHEGLLFAAPALAFGFLACPFLDLTFLRARAETPGRTGSAAFVVGFGALFLVMIMLTLLYSAPIVGYFSVSRLVMAHILLQSMFTVGAHLRELRLVARPIGDGFDAATPRRAPGPRARVMLVLAPVAFAFVPPALEPDARNVEAYWLFLGCYGTIFPAYVWATMPRRRMDAGASKALRAAVGIGLALCAAPLYVGAFVEKRWELAGFGAAILIVAPLVAALLARFAPRATVAPAA